MLVFPRTDCVRTCFFQTVRADVGCWRFPIVPWIRGRWQHGYGVREEPKVHGAKDPEKYFGKFFYDPIIHNADCFEFAVKTLGVDRILYGTDYPADMGYHQPAREIPGLSRLSKADQEKILSGNAKKIYGL